MRAIDLHAHLTPQCFQKEVLQGNTWHGMTVGEGELRNPRNAWTPEQRIADMDSLGVDIPVVSTNVAFYKYDQEVSLTTAIGVDCNNVVLVLNKIDAVEDRSHVDVLRARYDNAITLSAATGEGIDRLSRAVAEHLAADYIEAEIETSAGNGRLFECLKWRTVCRPPKHRRRLEPF